MRSDGDFLRDRYGQLWSNAIGRIRSGNIEIDPVLARKEVDRRRGMTLLFRPSPQVRQRVGEFLEELRKLEPEQHYYHPGELHVTFLSLFTATEEPGPFLARSEDYVAAVSASVSRLVPFPMVFAGVTASPGAIMIQGFANARGLNAARDDLRRELRSRGLDGSLDSRYRLEGAHMTVARFREPLRDGEAFALALEQRRAFDFGQFEGDTLELVLNDWYMSRGNTECLRRYQLVS